MLWSPSNIVVFTSSWPCTAVCVNQSYMTSCGLPEHSIGGTSENHVTREDRYTASDWGSTGRIEIYKIETIITK